MTAPAPQLAYEPTPAWHRRRGSRWLVLPVVVLLLVAAAAWFGPTFYRNISIMTLQRRCLDYHPPPQPRVVFIDEPTAAAAALLKQPNYFPDFSGGRRAVYHNPLWRSFAGSTQPVTFMGRRTSPGGNERLVVVHVGTLSGAGTEPYNRIFFAPYVEGTATLKGRHFVAGTATIPGLEMYRNRGDSTAVVEGIPDPADCSHFTIDYTLNNTPGTIDGWLNDDDTVTLSPRAGAVADVGARHVLWSPAGAPLPDWVAERAPVRDVTTQPIGLSGDEVGSGTC